MVAGDGCKVGRWEGGRGRKRQKPSDARPEACCKSSFRRRARRVAQSFSPRLPPRSAGVSVGSPASFGPRVVSPGHYIAPTSERAEGGRSPAAIRPRSLAGECARELKPAFDPHPSDMGERHCATWHGRPARGFTIWGKRGLKAPRYLKTVGAKDSRATGSARRFCRIARRVPSARTPRRIEQAGAPR